MHHNNCNSRTGGNKSALTVIAPPTPPLQSLPCFHFPISFLPSLPTISSLRCFYHLPHYYKKLSSCFKRKVGTINVRKQKYTLVTGSLVFSISTSLCIPTAFLTEGLFSHKPLSKQVTYCVICRRCVSFKINYSNTFKIPELLDRVRVHLSNLNNRQ